MSEYRRDILADRWVIIAENRAQRPDEFQVAEHAPRALRCPFCAGSECETPPATAVYPRSSAGLAADQWQVRVVPNKFPAVEQEPSAARESHALCESSGAFGAHEVIIETPSHVVSLTELSDLQIELTFAAYQDRLLHWRATGRLAYGIVFKNVRAEGGASLKHSHSQLVATSLIPRDAARGIELARAFHQRHGECIYCELLRAELASRRRMLAQTEHFAAYCPYASRFPYEMCILPRRHASRFEDLRDYQRRELAYLVCDLLRRLESVWREPAYNYLIHTAPWHEPCHDEYHWHLEILPRLTRMAGFELGTGCLINPLSPEEAASQLRAAQCAKTAQGHELDGAGSLPIGKTG